MSRVGYTVGFGLQILVHICCWAFLFRQVSGQTRRNVTFDDVNGDGSGSATISWRGNWRTLRGPGSMNLDISQIRDRTYHQFVQGGQAGWTFTFTGVGLWVFFIIPNAPAPALGVYTQFGFTIDGQSAAPPFNANLFDPGERPLYNLRVIHFESLTNTRHVLTCSVMARDGDPNNDRNYMFVDYLVYTTLQDGEPPPSAPPPGGTTEPGTTGSATAASETRISDSTTHSESHASAATSPVTDSRPTSDTQSQSQSRSRTPSDPQAHTNQTASPDSSITSEDPRKSAPVGAIAGAIVGGVLFLVLSSLLAMLLIRRRRKIENQRRAPDPLPPPSPSLPAKSLRPPSPIFNASGKRPFDMDTRPNSEQVTSGLPTTAVVNSDRWRDSRSRWTTTTITESRTAPSRSNAGSESSGNPHRDGVVLDELLNLREEVQRLREHVTGAPPSYHPVNNAPPRA